MDTFGKHYGYRTSPADIWASGWGHCGGKRQKQQLLSKDITLLETKSGRCGRGLGVRLCGRWWLLIIRGAIDEVSQHGSCVILLL